MMDLGGMSAAESNTKLNLGKNNRVKVVALDFELLTKSIQQISMDDALKVGAVPSLSSRSQGPLVSLGKVQPDISMIQNIANLLNVKLNDTSSKSSADSGTMFVQKKKSWLQQGEDDLSRLTGNTDSDSNSGTEIATSQSANVSNHSPFQVDIRAKYASKLKNKVQGGLAGVEVMKSQQQEMLKGGDAAGHLVARSIAAAQTVSSRGNKWLAKTGVGTLLTFLDKRCISIALLPPPQIMTEKEKDQTMEDMLQLTRQLPNIHFDTLVSGITKDPQVNSEKAPYIILDYISNQYQDVKTTEIMVVSDHDAMLRQARNGSMITCRVRPKHAPRGSVTTSYTVESINEVQNVVNDLCGISFNTVFSSRS